jgi:hypothetical protein
MSHKTRGLLLVIGLAMLAACAADAVGPGQYVPYKPDSGEIQVVTDTVGQHPHTKLQ